jgi:hypothetical protein
MRYRVLAVVAVVLGVALPAAALASRSATVSTLRASMRGSGEVGTKGSRTGTGSAVVKLYRSSGKACWTLSVRGLDKALSAHVHKASKKRTGPVVIPLGARFARKGCVTGLKAKTIDAIVKNPGAYYVNVHTKKYLDGAIRGQLHR